jgi:hypothetical protein
VKRLKIALRHQSPGRDIRFSACKDNLCERLGNNKLLIANSSNSLTDFWTKRQSQIRTFPHRLKIFLHIYGNVRFFEKSEKKKRIF